MRLTGDTGVEFGTKVNAEPVLLVGFSARSASMAAAASGLAPIAVDVCRDRDLIAICSQHYPLLSSDWVEQVSRAYSGIPCLLAGGMENQGDQLEKMWNAGIRLGNSPSQIREMRQVRNWMKWGIEAELPMPATICDPRAAEQLHSVDFIGSEWIWKSRLGVGGLHVKKVTERETREEIANRLEKGECYLQRVASGLSVGVTFLSSDFGSLVVGAAKSIGRDSQTFLPEYTYRGSMYPHLLPFSTRIKLMRFAELVTREVGIRGVWQADFMATDGELALLEINPRWSASMELMDSVCGLGLIGQHVASICGHMTIDGWEQISRRVAAGNGPESAVVCGKMVAYARDGFVVSQEQSDRWWSRVWKWGFPNSAIETRYGDIPEAGTRVEAGSPILTCFAAHRSEYALQQRLMTDVETVALTGTSNA